MKLRLLPVLLLLASSLPGQAPEDPGPHAVGWRQVVFTDPFFGQGTVRGRVYYPALQAGEDVPADPAAGPYPLIGFQHGWLGRPENYDLLCTHLASWGFVVASTGTETGLFPDTDSFARDTRAFLHWVDAESRNPASWLAGMAWDGPWGASGHSMGGGTLGLLIGLEPRVRVVVGLQSAWAGASGAANMAGFTGRAWQVAGSADRVVRPGTVHRWYEEALVTIRRGYFEVQGMGHTGCTDSPPGNEPLPGSEQHRLHRRLVAGLFRAGLLGEEDVLVDLLGSGMAGQPVTLESSCLAPPLWVAADSSWPPALRVGMGAAPGRQAWLARSLVPASLPTPFGLLGLDPASLSVFHQAVCGPAGVTEARLPLAAAWSGRTLHLQGLQVAGAAGRLTRAAAVPLP